MNIETGIDHEKTYHNIEQATLDDLSYIQDLNKKLFDYEIKNEFDKNIDPEWSFSNEGREELENRITSKDSVGLVKKTDNKIIGYLIGLINEEETGRIDSKYAELEHMFVDEHKRGEGIGEELVQAFKVWAKENGVSKIKVNVSFDNKKAIEFYKKVGLVPADITLSGEVQ